MSQLESRHFFRLGDRVRHRDGRDGVVVEAFALFARIRWDDRTEQEIEQFDPAVIVAERAGD